MLKYLIEKECKQFFRNPFLPKLILVMPLTVILIMPWAANQEIKDIRLAVVDNDRSSVSQRLIAKATASGYFRLIDVLPTYSAAMDGIESGETDMILENLVTVPRLLHQETGRLHGLNDTINRNQRHDRQLLHFCNCRCCPPASSAC